MLYLIYELERSPIGSFEDSLNVGPPSSKLSLVDDTFDIVFEALKTKPLLTSTWTVSISPYMERSKIVRLLNEYGNSNNIFIIKCTNKGKFTDIENTLIENKINYSLIDNSIVDKSYLVDFIKRNINYVDEDIPMMICKRVRYNVQKVINAVDILSTLDVVNKDTVKRFVDTASSSGFFDITLSLLGLSVKSSKSKVLNLMYQYRYGYKYIFRSVKKDLNDFRIIYNYILDGELSMDNMLDFQPKGDSNFKKISKYKKRVIIESFQFLSLEKLYIIQSLVENIPETWRDYYNLVNLVGSGFTD